MRVFRSLKRARGEFRRPLVTIGNFDGVHRGHQVILSQLVNDARSRNVDSVVLTFDPHPVAIIRPQAVPAKLMTLADRLRTLGNCEVSATVVQRFNKTFASVSAQEFVSRYLVGILDVQKIIVGHDLNYGHKRGGSVETLVEAGARHGFSVEVIGPVEVDGRPVHSSLVRKTVASGDVATAARLLGRPHLVRGRVVHGAKRGKTLGFATANVRTATPLVPPEGVYATKATLNGREIDSVTSIGTTPTFGGKQSVFESHLFATLDEFYGSSIEVRFFERLRDQCKFDTPELLVEQIGEDVSRAKKILAGGRGS